MAIEVDEIIRTLLYEWKEKSLKGIRKRDLAIGDYLVLEPKKILVLTGFRRVGKTYLAYDSILSLLEKYSKEEVVYINFEDERILAKTEILTRLLPVMEEEFGKVPKYLFLDEIQNIPLWSKWLRRVYDNNAETYFVVTGSNSKLTSKEIPTELRGRFIERYLDPLSFKEFLSFKGEEYNFKEIEYSVSKKAQMRRLLKEYVEYGGLPEIVLLFEMRKKEVAQSYFSTVVQRDIIERYDVKNKECLKALLRLLSDSKIYSFSKLYNTLKSLGYKIGKNTLYDYVGYIENAFFLFSLQVLSYKAIDGLQYPRKLYFVDNVFISSLSSKFSQNLGRLYENCVYMDLARRFRAKADLFYWRSRQEGYEVDFVLFENRKVKQLIQVSYDLGSEETKKREVRALIAGSRALNCKDLLVINKDYEAEEEIEWFSEKRKVKFVPLWKWLLSETK